MIKRNKVSFWGSKRRDVYLKLRNSLSVESKPNSFNKYSTDFLNLSISMLIQRLNRVLSKEENVFLNETTIEGVLLNRNSLPLVKRWLLYEYSSGVNVKPMRDPNKFVSGVTARFSSNYNCKKIFECLFGCFGYGNDLNAQNKVFCDKVKIDYIKMAYRSVFLSFNFDRNTQLEVIRLAFNGKTKTLCSIENDAYNHMIHQDVRESVKLLREVLLAYLPVNYSKTGGWVSKFVSYAITTISSNSANVDEFYKEFRFYFPELHAIIDEISSSIE